MALLSVASEGPLHGYGMRQRLMEIGFGEFKGGTIYPILKRLEDSQLLESSWLNPETGAAKKIFRITAKGASTVDEGLHTAESLIKIISSTREGGNANE